jgi:hypothetical protein
MTTTASTSPSLAVTCRVCGAQPSHHCLNSLGRTTEVHPVRHFAWVHAGRPSHPSVPELPAEIEMASPWDLEGYRDLYGVDRAVTDHTVRVYAFGCQGLDGTIDNLAVHLADGEESGPSLNSDQARELAAALLEAAAQLDGWKR